MWLFKGNIPCMCLLSVYCLDKPYKIHFQRNVHFIFRWKVASGPVRFTFSISNFLLKRHRALTWEHAEYLWIDMYYLFNNVQGHTYTTVLLHGPLCQQYCPDLVQRPCRAFEASSPVCLPALNISGWADGAQMDSKVGMSLKIHDTHHDQGEWRGGGIKH